MNSDYDESCRVNQELMAAKLKDILGDMYTAMVPPAVKSAPKKRRAPRKRKAPSAESDDENGPQKLAKARRVVEHQKEGERKEGRTETTGLRRSGRNRDKKVDYNADQFDQTGPTLVSVQAGLREMGTEPRSVSNRVHDPKVFGAIPGIKVGTWWMTREECSRDAVHAPWVGGIAGSRDGAWSVALSGGYEDDVDFGDAFTYTGAGGRDLKGTKSQPKNLRTAPQSSHQSFENRFNNALKKSCETKKPIRVIRGYKLKSPYAPAEGYRYDGLYTVEKAWMEKGLNPGGWKVCKFAFKRVPGQAPLKFDGDEGNSSSEDEDADDSNDKVDSEDSEQEDSTEKTDAD